MLPVGYKAAAIARTSAAADTAPGSRWPRERSRRRAARPLVAIIVAVAAAPLSAAAVTAFQKSCLDLPSVIAAEAAPADVAS